MTTALKVKNPNKGAPTGDEVQEDAPVQHLTKAKGVDQDLFRRPSKRLKRRNESPGQGKAKLRRGAKDQAQRAEERGGKSTGSLAGTVSETTRSATDGKEVIAEIGCRDRADTARSEDTHVMGITTEERGDLVQGRLPGALTAEGGRSSGIEATEQIEGH